MGERSPCDEFDITHRVAVEENDLVAFFPVDSEGVRGIV